MALYHFSAKALSRSSRNTVRAIAYRAGCELDDVRTGQTFNYEDKPVQHVELLLPQDAPSWALKIQKLMTEDRQKGVQDFVDKVEAAEKRIDAQVWKEFEFSLHRELTEDQNKALAREFVQDQLCGRGMAAQLNFHFDVDEETGKAKPHCHVVTLTRRLEENGLSPKKDRDWNKKELLCELRQQWQDYSNFHLKLHGHEVQIDHRSYKECGIKMEPQPKLGRGVLEQGKRIHKLEGGDSFSTVTDKAKAFYDVQLRNLYRILRHPEMVFEIVTKHHATFMWADVQKVIHRYVDEAPLFQRLETRLKKSNELLTLRFNPEAEDKAIYTTCTMLKAERSLVETAEELGRSKTHGVNETQVVKAITNANEMLKEQGGLSLDQIMAVYHLSEAGQIKCIVGIAGAGKTTALGVCHEIWQAEGYRVYGLTPTGKAAQNLEQSGISSTTLHKFLKSFEEGRCQYNSKSVLVLDEAGMVDVGRFEKLLGAVKHLGVKVVVVGDGAQLQPVEAGPAFRLVTTRLGTSELNTVVRQKADWQRDATILFGQQKTSEAIQIYADKGYVHIIEEKLPSGETVEDFVKLYEMAQRTSSLLYREMANEVKNTTPHAPNLYPLIKEHQDFDKYLQWKGIERKAAQNILQKAEASRPLLEAKSLDSLKIALLLVNKNQSIALQQEEAKKLLKDNQLDYLIGVEKSLGTSIEVRQKAKEALIESWHASFNETSEKSSLMLAFSNRDVNDLNRLARSLLKDSGHLSQTEVSYTIKKEIEDDFGRKHILQEDKGFAKGDQIVFTRNHTGLGVKNGSMGTILELDTQKIQVKLEGG